mmetsp:Transcript_129586/g.242461  ORF Transcript_129586/g.242461 Transcript_129586/m.242461 type:complete len:232 (+) Transcript_129586:78-773(+)
MPKRIARLFTQGQLRLTTSSSYLILTARRLAAAHASHSAEVAGVFEDTVAFSLNFLYVMLIENDLVDLAAIHHSKRRVATDRVDHSADAARLHRCQLLHLAGGQIRASSCQVSLCRVPPRLIWGDVSHLYHEAPVQVVLGREGIDLDRSLVHEAIVRLGTELLGDLSRLLVATIELLARRRHKAILLCLLARAYALVHAQIPGHVHEKAAAELLALICATHAVVGVHILPS